MRMKKTLYHTYTAVLMLLIFLLGITGCDLDRPSPPVFYTLFIEVEGNGTVEPEVCPVEGELVEKG